MSPFVMTRIMPQHHNRSTTAARYPRVEAGPQLVHERNSNSGPENPGRKFEKGLENTGLRVTGGARIHMGNSRKLNEDITSRSEARPDSLFRLTFGRSGK